MIKSTKGVDKRRKRVSIAVGVAHLSLRGGGGGGGGGESLFYILISP